MPRRAPVGEVGCKLSAERDVPDRKPKAERYKRSEGEDHDECDRLRRDEAIIRPRRRRNGGAESAVRPLVILLVGRRRRFCVARLAVASAKPDAAEAVKAHGPAAALIKGEERGEEGSGEQEEGKEGEAGGKAEVGDAWEVHRGRDEESDDIG